MTSEGRLRDSVGRSWKLEQRISDDECDLDTPEIEVTVTRRAVLEPESDPSR